MVTLRRDFTFRTLLFAPEIVLGDGSFAVLNNYSFYFHYHKIYHTEFLHSRGGPIPRPPVGFTPPRLYTGKFNAAFTFTQDVTLRCPPSIPTILEFSLLSTDITVKCSGVFIC